MSYNYSTLKNFTDNFPNCPKCDSTLHIDAASNTYNYNMGNHSFEVELQNNEIKIDIVSEYFIAPKKQHIEFSISTINGNIISCQKGNEFVSLYDLDATLSKKCNNCAKNSPWESFYQSISIFYDRSISSFRALPSIEYFGFQYEDKFYKFTNDFIENKSDIKIDDIRKHKTIIIPSPYIPFTKFDFSNKEKLFTKINNIQLLR